MPSNPQIRKYKRSECITFRKTKEAFGGLSNMAAGYPLNVNGIYIRTSEALYQACRFPHLPEVQKLIIAQNSPMTAKMKSKPYRDQSRSDWDNVRVKIMDWCLRVKLVQNWDSFSSLLLATGDKPIVEDSHKDDFWGALSVDYETLSGVNALGRLLMQLREDIKYNPEKLEKINPLNIKNFYLCNQLIQAIFKDDESQKNNELIMPSIFDYKYEEMKGSNLDIDQTIIDTETVSFPSENKQNLINNIFDDYVIPQLNSILIKPTILKDILKHFPTITQGQMKEWLSLAHDKGVININKQKNKTLYVLKSTKKQINNEQLESEIKQLSLLK